MRQKIFITCFVVCMFVAGVFGGLLIIQPRPTATHAVGTSDWPTFLGDGTRSGANLNESIITPATAGSLKLSWKFTTGGYVVASPAIVGGVMYVGSWDGYEYAINIATHQQIWKTNLGLTTGQGKPCYDPTGVGVTSSAAVQNGVVYVGGGDGNLYALNAASGAVLWKQFLGAAPYYNFASPLLYNNTVYTGLASFCDPPYAQGKVVAFNASNGAPAANISLVPNGQTGATVWGSPAVDAATNTVYITTGNPGSQTDAQQPYAEAVVALDGTTLAVKSHWQIPLSQEVNDSDFGVAPTLFDVNGVGYLGALNKNGIYYVFNRANLAAGPVWQQVAAATPLTQGDNVASSCYNNGVIYVGSTANDTPAGGKIHAYNAVTGQQIWLVNTPGNVQSSLLCTNGLIVDAQNNDVEVRSASTGALLFHYTTGNRVQSTPVISNGVLYVGSRDGSIYAFTSNGSPPPTTPSGPVSKTWYFAEGRVGSGFEEFLTIGNPSNVNDCPVNIEYLLESGAPVTRQVTVAHDSRWTESVNSDLGTLPNASLGRSVATVITTAANSPCLGVVAERPMYFNFYNDTSDSDVVGATHTATSFYFADVASGGPYRSYITILNPPGGSTATVTANYYAGGVLVGTQSATVNGGARGTIAPNALTNLPQHFAAVVTSTQAVVVERPTYFNSLSAGAAGIVTGASSVVGSQTLQHEWFFAEGYAGTNNSGGVTQEDLVISNLDPTNTTATVTVNLEYLNGTKHPFTVTVQPKSQAIWNVNTLGVGAASQEVSADVVSTGANIVVSRQMFFHYAHTLSRGTLSATGGTEATGQTGTYSAYSFAEGYSNNGYNEWLTLQNPTANAETIYITMVNGLGSSYTEQVSVGANTRATVDITAQVLANLAPSGSQTSAYEVSMTVQTLNNGGSFVAERPMYSNTTGLSSLPTQGGNVAFGYNGH